MDSVPQLRDVGDPLEALTSTIQSQGESIAAELERASRKLGAGRVHSLRVSLRRLLSAFELAAVVACEVRPRLRRRLTKLLQRLSPLRDVQVQRRALSRSASPSLDSSPFAARLRRRQRKLSRKARRQMDKVDVSVFEHDLRAVMTALGSVPNGASTGTAVEAAMHGRLARLHLDMEARRRALSREGEQPRALHRLRLTLKNYRYSLEIVEPALPARARELGLTVASLQKALGCAHDAHLLAILVRAESEPERGALRSPLEELCSQLERDRDAAQLAATTALDNAQLEWPFP